MREVPVNLRDRSYPIFIQPSGLETLGQRIQEFNLGTEAAVISDTTVSILYGDQTLDVLRAAGIQSTLHTVPEGEESTSRIFISVRISERFPSSNPYVFAKYADWGKRVISRGLKL